MSALCVLGALAAIAGAADPSDAHLARRVSGSTIEAVRGETLLVEIRSELKDVPTGNLVASVGQTGRTTSVSIVPWIEELSSASDKRERVFAKAVLPIRVSATAPIGEIRVSAQLSFRDTDGDRALAWASPEWTIRVRAPSPSLEELDSDRRAYLDHQDRAKRATELVPSLRGSLKLDRLEIPPDADRLRPEEKLALKAFIHSRMRADAARQHLRAAAEVDDPAISLAAIRTIASLFEPIKRQPPQKTKLKGTPSEMLDRVRAAIDDLDLAIAEAVLIRVRFRPDLTVQELARALALLGAISVARGDDEQARIDFGQATCLDPSVSAPSKRAPLVEPFEAIRAKARCKERLEAHSSRAARRDGREGEEIYLETLFGPDPFHVIDRGTIEVFAEGGASALQREVIAGRGDLATIASTFGPKELPAGDPDRIRVRVTARDAAGIPLAVLGAPEPTTIPIVEERVIEEEKLPLWVWIAGGAALAVATTTVLILSSGGEPEPGIGPVLVTF
jgi:hypothetical protein